MANPGTRMSLQPTYQGYVATTQDALVLFEACLNGTLHHVPRRPHDRERSSLIRSGCVFIYEENASGIKRWTDGVPWSPSRILGNFLVYRELLKPFPPGEKKRATKRSKRPSKPGEPYARPSLESPTNTSDSCSPTLPTNPRAKQDANCDKETERALIGSLIDSYGFKDDGLVKKTMSVNVQGVHHHLVSYYKVEDVLNNLLETPTQSSLLQYIKPRPELTTRQNFRAPLDDVDDGLDAHFDESRNPYGFESFDRRSDTIVNGIDYHQHSQPSASHSFYSGIETQPFSGAASQSSSLPTTFGASPGSSASHAASFSHSLPIKTEDYMAYNPITPYSSRFDSLNTSVGQQASPPSERSSMPLHAVPLSQPPRGRSDTSQTSNNTDTKSNNLYSRGYAPSLPRADDALYPSLEQRWGSSSASHIANLPTYQYDRQYWNMPGNMAMGHGHYPSVSPISQWGQNAV